MLTQCNSRNSVIRARRLFVPGLLSFREESGWCTVFQSLVKSNCLLSLPDDISRLDRGCVFLRSLSSSNQSRRRVLCFACERFGRDWLK